MADEEGFEEVKQRKKRKKPPVMSFDERLLEGPRLSLASPRPKEEFTGALLAEESLALLDWVHQRPAFTNYRIVFAEVPGGWRTQLHLDPCVWFDTLPLADRVLRARAWLSATEALPRPSSPVVPDRPAHERLRGYTECECGTKLWEQLLVQLGNGFVHTVLPGKTTRGTRDTAVMPLHHLNNKQMAQSEVAWNVVLGALREMKWQAEFVAINFGRWEKGLSRDCHGHIHIVFNATFVESIHKMVPLRKRWRPFMECIRDPTNYDRVDMDELWHGRLQQAVSLLLLHMSLRCSQMPPQDAAAEPAAKRQKPEQAGDNDDPDA